MSSSNTHIRTDIDPRAVSTADTIAFSSFGSRLTREAVEIIDFFRNSVRAGIFLINGAFDSVLASEGLREI